MAQAPASEVSKKGTAPSSELRQLSDLTETGGTGAVCVKIDSVSAPLTSRSSWKYRLLKVADESTAADVLISEAQYVEWKFQARDYIVCSVKSNGLDSTGRLSAFFNAFLGPFDAAKMLYETKKQLIDLKLRSAEHMKPAETVYQISGREARSLLVLIRLWTQEGKPQHYTKWCQMHQIVATNLFYMGLVKRTGSMSGYYYPTQEALEFFEGKKLLAKRRVFTKDKDGRHLPAQEDGEEKSFQEYLSDRSDRETALQEYSQALDAYRQRIKAQNA